VRERLGAQLPGPALCLFDDLPIELHGFVRFREFPV
jgi:hypothetical protein